MKDKKFRTDGPGGHDLWVYLSVLAIAALALLVTSKRLWE
jgi:hypothetical protein